jgi:hypothetical protein
MAITTATGVVEYGLGYVVPTNNSTWAATSGTTWASFKSWLGNPVSPLVWVTNPVDLGVEDYFNIKTSAIYGGTLSKYEIYVSSTGTFAGEESKTIINEGDTNIPAFYGRYARIAAFIDNTANEFNLQQLQTTLENRTFDITKHNINTSSLPLITTIISTATVSDARVLDINRRVSQVVNVQITPHYPSGAAQPYVTAGYVTVGYVVGSIVIPTPQIVQKTVTTSSFVNGVGTAFVVTDQDGTAIGNLVDVRMTVLPEQYMLNGQLLVR